MRHPNPLRHHLPRLAVPTVLALALPLQTAAAHHHWETDTPTLRLAQSGEAPPASEQPASPPDGAADTGMPEDADAPDGSGSPDEAGATDTTATDADGTGNGSEADEEAPRTDTPEDGEGEDGYRNDQEALGDEETRATEEDDGGEDARDGEEDGQDRGDEDRAADDGSRDDDAGPHGRITRAAFTSGIEDREPVDRLETVDAGVGEVLFFTEIQDHEGGTIVHQWRYQGWDMGEVRFDVDGPRWRVWSSKTLQPEWAGPWTVRVVDQDGRLLDEYRFRVNGDQ